MIHPARSVPGGQGSARRKVVTDEQFRKCENPACLQTLFVKELEKNLFCCKYCGHHFRIGARRRLDYLFGEDGWRELFTDLAPLDPLQFKGLRSYRERLGEAQAKTGLKDAAVCAEGRLAGRTMVCAVLDFRFMGGSMGSVVGEKVTRALEYALAARRPALAVCCSGGARMDEGVFSLMQMAKTSAAVGRLHAAGLPYFTVLTDPTLAGVSASFAFLGDVILAEPHAMIGFTGARVIEETTKMRLPEGFQEAEFLLQHGQLDLVVPRAELPAVLGRLLEYAPGDAESAAAAAVSAAEAHSAEQRAKPARGARKRASRTAPKVGA